MWTKNVFLLGVVFWMFFSEFQLGAQAMTLDPYHKSPIAPPFEKIYINPNCLVDMPDGLYYYHANGYAEKVRTLRHDCNGFYILRIEYQCPLCGRTYLDKEPDADHGCPLFMRQILPKIWIK